MAEPNPHLAPYAGHLRVRVCGICMQDHKVLVVQHRATIGNKAFWAPPGGGLSFGETLKDCLTREVAEETGLNVQPGKFLGIHEFVQEPLHALEFFFEATAHNGILAAGHDPEVPPELQMIQDVRFMSREELNKINCQDLHPIFHNLTHLDDLHRPRNRFIQ